MNLDFEMHVEAPVGRVFDFLTDDEKVAYWSPELVETRYAPGYDHDDPVGGKFVQIMRRGSSQVAIDGEVTAWERPHLYAARSSWNGNVLDETYELTDEAGGTHFSYRSRPVDVGLFYRFSQLLFGWYSRRHVRQKFDRLKNMVEGYDPAPPDADGTW